MGTGLSLCRKLKSGSLQRSCSKLCKGNAHCYLNLSCVLASRVVPYFLIEYLGSMTISFHLLYTLDMGLLFFMSMLRLRPRALGVVESKFIVMVICICVDLGGLSCRINKGNFAKKNFKIPTILP